MGPVIPPRMKAVEALAGSSLFREAMGGELVERQVAMKRYEIRRFLSRVTDREHREDLEAFRQAARDEGPRIS